MDDYCKEGEGREREKEGRKEGFLAEAEKQSGERTDGWYDDDDDDDGDNNLHIQNIRTHKKSTK